MYKILFKGLILFLFTINAMAQEQEKQKSKELFAGIIFAPAAVTTFEGELPFSTGSSLFLTTAIAQGDWSFAPYYNFGANNAGAFVTYNIWNDLGTYIAMDKALVGNTGNYSLGFTTPILEDYIQGYVEIGSTYGNDATTFLGIGLYFNILKPLKSW